MMNSLFDPAVRNKDIDSKIIISLERLSQVFKVSLLKETKDHNLSPIQIQTLIFINSHNEEKSTLTQLAKEFDITKATMSDAVKTLEQKKLIKRTINPGDSRSSLLKLTTKGKNIVNKLSFYAEDMKDSISKVDKKTKEDVYLFLINMIYELWKKEIISVQRMCFTCRYLKEGSYGNNDYFCNLLEKPLKKNELRVDCLEHEIK